MSYGDLLERMKCNDTDAFLEMTERYGWSLYSAIREKYPDHAMADEVYNNTMNTFYHILSDSSAEDPLEALLHGFADRITPARTCIQKEINVPDIRLSPAKLPVKRTGVSVKKHRFRRMLGVVMILLAVFLAIWHVVGLFMQMGLFSL